MRVQVAADVQVESGEGVLDVCVRDEHGGAHFGSGSGLAGLKDRVEALGGRLSLDSPKPGAGTTLGFVLPLGHPRRPERPTGAAGPPQGG